MPRNVRGNALAGLRRREPYRPVGTTLAAAVLRLHIHSHSTSKEKQRDNAAITMASRSALPGFSIGCTLTRYATRSDQRTDENVNHFISSATACAALSLNHMDARLAVLRIGGSQNALCSAVLAKARAGRDVTHVG